ncbi:MAG: ELM1/GtrOC1 family putative glycosyltransferase, partial [Candidatus Puniceispirillum sp.]
MTKSPSTPDAKPDEIPDAKPDIWPDIWIISDGTAGMRLQSLALAEAMGWTAAPGFREIIVTPRQPLRSLPRLGRIPMLASHLPVSTPALPNADGGFPDLLVTCGRRMAGLSIAMRHRARIAGQPMKTIHIQDPRLDPACFDILLVPAH